MSTVGVAKRSLWRADGSDAALVAALTEQLNHLDQLEEQPAPTAVVVNTKPAAGGGGGSSSSATPFLGWREDEKGEEPALLTAAGLGPNGEGGDEQPQDDEASQTPPVPGAFRGKCFPYVTTASEAGDLAAEARALSGLGTVHEDEDDGPEVLGCSLDFSCCSVGKPNEDEDKKTDGNDGDHATEPEQQQEAGNEDEDEDAAAFPVPPSWRRLASCSSYVNSSVSMLETETEADGLDCWLVTCAAEDCEEVVCTEHGWGDGRLAHRGEEIFGDVPVRFRMPSCREAGCHAHYCPAHYVEETLPLPLAGAGDANEHEADEPRSCRSHASQVE